MMVGFFNRIIFQSVTLGDEEASRRGVQKSVLERKGPATFSCAVEIVSKMELRVHRSLETTVDAILAGKFSCSSASITTSPPPEKKTFIRRGNIYCITQFHFLLINSKIIIRC